MTQLAGTQAITVKISTNPTMFSRINWAVGYRGNVWCNAGLVPIPHVPEWTTAEVCSHNAATLPSCFV